MIVTAEPYYAVRQPSNVVVLENVVRTDTKGTTEAVNAKYELMGRGGYIPTGYKFDPVVLDAKVPWSSSKHETQCASRNLKRPTHTQKRAISNRPIDEPREWVRHGETLSE